MTKKKSERKDISDSKIHQLNKLGGGSGVGGVRGWGWRTGPPIHLALQSSRLL